MPYLTNLINENANSILNYQNMMKKEISKFNQKIKLTELHRLKLIMNQNFNNKGIKVNITFESC